MGYITNDNKIEKTIAFANYSDDKIIEIEVINNEEIEFDFQSINDPDIDIAKDEYYYMFISESEEKYFVLEDFVPEDFVPEDDKDNHFVQENYLTQAEIASFNQKILIVADYGDGVIEYHSKPLELFDSASEKWSTFVHKFNFKKDYFIGDNKEREMIFTIYTKIGSQKTYNISYTVLDPSEIANDAYKKVKFRLLSANLDNNGKISFMLDNIAGTKSKIILAEIKKS